MMQTRGDLFLILPIRLMQKQNNRTGLIDNGKIDLSDELDLLKWSDKLDVTSVKIRAAINAVGSDADTVAAYLKKRAKS